MDNKESKVEQSYTAKTSRRSFLKTGAAVAGGSTSNKDLKIHFEQAWQAANSQGEEGHTVTDLRAFNVIFA
jgi:hypothetical protein